MPVAIAATGAHAKCQSSPAKLGTAYRNESRHTGGATSRAQHRCAALAFRGAVTRRNVVLLGIVCSRLLKLRPHDLAHGGNPVGELLPLFAVPLLDKDRAIAFMVIAGHLDRSRKPREPQFLQACLRQVEMLKPPPHLLTRQWLVAELGHSCAHGFYVVHGIDETTVVQDFADIIGLRRSLVAVVDLLDDGGVQWKICANAMEIARFIPFGSLTRRDHVYFAP